MAGEVIAAQLDGLAKYRVDLHEFALHGALAGKAQQILDDILGTLRLVEDDL